MRDHLVLYINGIRQVVRGHDAFLSLSDFLRRRLGLIGTKIVCSEGDCGACTVLVGRSRGVAGDHTPPIPSPRWGGLGRGDEASANAAYAKDGHHNSSSSETSFPIPHSSSPIQYLPIDSCIQFLFQLDGTHIVTVEGLRPDRELNPIQQAMVDCHGSQCGFCTPGFVMAMTGMLEVEALDESNLRSGLTGNLCRCTGYTPIIDAGLACRDEEFQRINDLYPPEAMLAEFAELEASPLKLRAEWFGQPHVAFCPTTLDDALEYLAEHPTVTIVAGATDLGVRINKLKQIPSTIVDLNRIHELSRVEITNNEIQAGARASWTSILNACGLAVPQFTYILSRFGGPQIRHVGTIAGNIANGSPIADSLPFLFVMEATLTLARTASAVRATREVNINDFYLGYKQLDLKPGELITEVRIPLPDNGDLLQLHKISRRRDLDISGFTAAIRLRLSEDGVISNASIALGGVGPTVLRARQTEQFLLGREFTEETMQAAGELAVQKITPINDVRGTANYRRQLTRNIFLKFYHQTQTDLAPA
jgi:xanthine dehydrogenase small subunit